jgi:hypothetical protein
MTTSTSPTAIRIGNGVAVHAGTFSSFWEQSVPVCNGWAGTNGGARRARISPTTDAVTCKRCIAAA